jgi:outer membrane protein assembly factor BamB
MWDEGRGVVLSGKFAAIVVFGFAACREDAPPREDVPAVQTVRQPLATTNETDCGSSAGLANAPSPMRGFCPTHAGRSLYLGPPKASLNWSFDTHFDVQTQPAIDTDGSIYFGSDKNRLHALTDTGGFKWEVAVGGDVKSSPAIAANGLIYFGSDDSKVYAVTRAGQIQHSFNTFGFVRSSPAIASDGSIFVGSDDNALYHLSANLTLIRKWTTLGDIRSSPAIGQNGLIYVGSGDDKVYAFNRAGANPVWTFRTGADVDSSPAIGRNGTVYIGSDDDKLYALDGATGVKRWSFDTSLDVGSSPALGPDGTIYVGSENDRLYALEDRGATVAVKWSVHLGNDVHGSPVVGADGTVFVGSDDNRVFALRASDGAILWRFDTSGDVRGAPTLGPNRNLYVGSDDDRLYAIGPKSAKECTASLLETPTTGDPLTLDIHIGAIQCMGGGTTYCESLLVGTVNFDLRTAALRYMAQTFTPQQYKAITRDRSRKLNAALKDPALLAAYCKGDADGDIVPDDRDDCPSTPDLTPTTDRGCTDPTLPDAPSRKAIDFILKTTGIFFDRRCEGAPIPNMPLPTGWCELREPPKFAYVVGFRGVTNQPAGCPVWYQFRVETAHPQAPNFDNPQLVRHRGYGIGPDELGTSVASPPGGPGDLHAELPALISLGDPSSDLLEALAIVTVRAVNGNGMRSEYSPPIKFNGGGNRCR